MAARGTDGQCPVELGPPLDGPVHCKLLVQPHSGGIQCTVVGDDGETVAPEEVGAWREAASSAVFALGHGERDFTWDAIGGTSPHALGLDRVGALKHPQSLGPVLLTPGAVCTREQIFGDRVAEGFGIRHSFPVIASGQVRTYTWERVGRIAELSLRRTCALLSLFTGAVWIPRTHPCQRVRQAPGSRRAM